MLILDFLASTIVGNKLCCLSHPVYDVSVLAVLYKIQSSNQGNSDLNMVTVFWFFAKIWFTWHYVELCLPNDILIFLTPNISECGLPLWFSW